MSLETKAKYIRANSYEVQNVALPWGYVKDEIASHAKPNALEFNSVRVQHYRNTNGCWRTSQELRRKVEAFRILTMLCTLSGSSQ
jgi:hypothetical protein